jgi:hypothetical protein
MREMDTGADGYKSSRIDYPSLIVLNTLYLIV